MSDEPKKVAVPADLLTAACQLIGKLPAEHAARVYIDLLACKPVETPEPDQTSQG